MRAVRLHAWGEPPRVDEVEPPEPSPGATLVEVEAATVSHLDRTIWRGELLHPPVLPHVPGVEGSGTVVASDSFAPGERVRLRGGGLGTTRPGTWSELVLAPDAAVGHLPDDVSFSLGSIFFSPCTSAWVSLHEIARLQPGETVLVSGASGAMGSMTVQLAVEHGARVIAVVSSAEAAEALPDGVGAIVGLEALAEAGPIDADVLIDPVGGALLDALLPHVRPGGRAVLVGYVGGATLSLSLPTFVQRDVALLPLNMMRREAAGRAAAPELLARLGDGRLVLPATTFALADAAGALAWLGERGHRGRAALLPQM